MKSILWLSVMVALTYGTQAPGQAGTGPTDTQEATKKLGVFLGKWESTGAFADTKFSMLIKSAPALTAAGRPWATS